MGTAPSSNYESYTGVAISGILAPPGREEWGVGGGERRHPSFSGANVALIKEHTDGVVHKTQVWG